MAPTPWWWSRAPCPVGCEQAFAVAVQSDGKIVAAGGCVTEFELARYNADGSLDGTFGGGGKVTTRFGLGLTFTVAHAIVLQPDGKIVVAGSATSATVPDFGLARYNPNGTLDTSFGNGGKVTTDIGGLDSPDRAWAVALQPDGKLVAAGSSMGPSGGDAFALARYEPAGTLDATFGASGKVTTDFPGHNDHVYALALQQDGKVVAAGDSSPDFALARYAATTVDNNNPPVASNDNYATAEDTPSTVAAPGILANDSDVDGDPLTATRITRPAHGTLTPSSNGSFTYTPARGFIGQDSFTYTASDGAAPSNPATVTITVASKILFTSTRDGNSEIYVMNADGSGVTRLTTNAAIDANSVWSPDHKRIAFTSTRDDPSSEIYAMQADGTAVTRLTTNPAGDVLPDW